MIAFKQHQAGSGPVTSTDLNKIQSNTQQGLADLANAIGFSKVSNKPSSSTAAGTVGQYYADASGLYLCIANSSWIRLAGSTF